MRICDIIDRYHINGAFYFDLGFFYFYSATIYNFLIIIYQSIENIDQILTDHKNSKKLIYLFIDDLIYKQLIY